MNRGTAIAGTIIAAAIAGAAALLRREDPQREVGPPPSEAPSPVPGALQEKGEPLQLTGDGVGELVHRRYWIDIADARLTPRALMRQVKRELPAFSPSRLAAFRKTRGWRLWMAVGDEYDINILGPFNGGVRVTEVTPTSFTLVTLRGHPEAGQIRFVACTLPEVPGGLRFEIHSWARNRDSLVYMGYYIGRLGKLIQRQVWVSFCRRVAERSGGTALGKVGVRTEELPITGEVVPVV
jgi:hypothetical protein